MSLRRHKEGKKRTKLSFDTLFFKTHSLLQCSNINFFSLIMEDMKLQTIHHQDLYTYSRNLLQILPTEPRKYLHYAETFLIGQ